MTVDSHYAAAVPRVLRYALPIGLLLLGVLVFFGTGVFGLGRDATYLRQDFSWLWAAGHMWARGGNPYDYEAFRPVLMEVVGPHLGNAFVYPPQLALFAMHWGLVPFGVGTWLLTVENIAAAGLLMWGVYTMLRNPVESGRIRSNPVEPWYALSAAALVIVCPIAAHVTAMGQSSLLVAAAVIWGWILIHRDRPVVGGVLLALAAVKPMFLILPVIWLVMQRRWVAVASFVAAGAVLSSWAVVAAGGPIELARDWLASIADYKSFHAQSPGFRHGTSIGGVLYLLGLDVPDLTLLAVPIVIWLAWQSRPGLARPLLGPTDAIACLLLLYFVFGAAHDYDFVVLAPVLAAVAYHVRQSPPWFAAAVMCFVLISFPQRVLRRFDSDLLLQWRMPVLLAVLLGLLWLAWRQRRAAT